MKDARSLLLDADVHAGIVTDRERRVLGLVAVAAIASQLRETGIAGGGSRMPDGSIDRLDPEDEIR